MFPLSFVEEQVEDIERASKRGEICIKIIHNDRKLRYAVPRTIK